MSASTSQIAIKITAVDAASKQIDALNRQIAKLDKGTQAQQKSLMKMSDTTGIKALGSGMRDLARELLGAFENIGRIVAPLGVLTGAASLAGLAKMTSEWANMGTQLGLTSQRTGVSAEKLYDLENAAKLAGSSAGAMDSGLKSLRDNLTNLATGRAGPETVAAFNGLHIAVRNADGSMRSTASVLPEIADKLAGIKDPAIQAQYAQLLLGSAGEELLPVLRKGAAGLAAYAAEAHKHTAMTQEQIDKANQLRESQTGLELSVAGLTNTIASDLEPVLKPLMDSLSHWIDSNRDLIGQDVAGWIGDISKEIGPFLTEANKVAQALGGWKTVIEGIVAVRMASWAASMVVGLNPLTLALAAMAETIYKIETFEEHSGGKDLAVGSPLWRGVSEEEQSNYVNSPRSQAFLHPNGENQNPFHWYNPGSWLGRGNGPASLPMTLPGAPGSSQSDPRGIRNNNPLNLSYAGQEGAIGADSGNFSVFKDMVAGVAASERQLLLYQSRGLTTPRQMITKWAPPSENNTEAYIASVAKQTGLDPDKPANLNDPEVAAKLIQAMSKVETGRNVDVGIVRQGVETALGKGSGDPANIGGPGYAAAAPTATVQNGSGVAPVKAAETNTVNGSATLSVKVTSDRPTQVNATTDGNLFSGAPKIMQSMSGPGGIG